MNAPTKIKIKSDGNELTFVEKKKDGTYIYQYKKSQTKKDHCLPLTEEQLIKLINNNE